MLQLLILLTLALLVVLPIWPYSRRWSYFPSLALALILLALVVSVVAMT